MLKFCGRLALFLAIVAITSWLLNQHFIRVVMFESNTLRRYRQFGETGNSTRFLFLGDSHVATGINPQYFDGAFNLALHAEGYDGTLITLRAVLDGGWGGDSCNVLLPFDIHSFSSFRNDWRYNDWFYHYYLSSEGKRGDQAALFGFCGRIQEYRDWVDLLLGRRELRQLVGGYPIDKALNDAKTEGKTDADRALKRAREHVDPELYTYEDETIVADFKDALKLCRERDLRVYLVRYPVSDTYLGMITDSLKLDRLHQRIANDLDWGDKLQLLDYQQLFTDRSELFRDPDHLSQEGAKLLTIRIAADLQDY